MDEFQSKERCEDSERVMGECLSGKRPEARGVDWQTGDGEVVVADGVHSHDGEQATHRRQLLRSSESNGAMTFNLDTVLDLDVLLAVDVRHELQQCPILRDFALVHSGEGGGEQGPDRIRCGSLSRGHGVRCVGGWGDTR